MPVTQRGSSWQAAVTHQGKRYRRDFPTKAEAELWEVESKARMMRGLTPEMTYRAKADRKTGDGRPRTLGQLYRIVCERHWRGSKAERTSVLNGRLVTDLIGHETPLDSIRLTTVDDLRQRLFDQGNSSSTVNRKLAALRLMLNYASDREWLDRVPKVKGERERQHRIRFISIEEEQRALLWFRNRGDMDMHDLMCVAIDTGLRMGELLRLEARDIPGGKVLTVWEAKSHKPRTIPLTQRASAILGQRMYQRPMGPLFPIKSKNVNDRWNAMRHDLGLSGDEQFVPHAMRHTFCSRLAMRGANAIMIRDLAGHSTIAVTQRYMHLSPASLEGAIALLEPGGSATPDTCGIQPPSGGYNPTMAEKFAVINQ